MDRQHAVYICTTLEKILNSEPVDLVTLKEQIGSHGVKQILDGWVYLCRTWQIPDGSGKVP